MMRLAVLAGSQGLASGQTLRNWELKTRDGSLVDATMLSQPVHDDEMIEAVNADPTSTWVAGRNTIFEGATLSEAMVRMGTLENTDPTSFLPYKAPSTIMDVPDEFDWRTDPRGANCPSLKEIRDQANCGSCWAFGSVEAMTDRICIASNATETDHLSAQDVASCDHLGDMGCNGGVPSTAYTYYKNTGVVTGGNYGDKSRCYSYQLAPCAHHSVSAKYPNCSDSVPTPKCAKACTDNQAITWAEDKKHGQGGYAVCKQGGGTSCPESMQQEIYQNGPITGMFFVHQSFLTYKSGVYTSNGLKDPMLGGHAIKIMGWGTENGTPYWLVANSWNEDWGDAGFFKIKRGSNEDQIENPVINGGPVAGLPAKAQKEISV